MQQDFTEILTSDSSPESFYPSLLELARVDIEDTDNHGSPSISPSFKDQYFTALGFLFQEYSFANSCDRLADFMMGVRMGMKVAHMRLQRAKQLRRDWERRKQEGACSSV